MARLSKIDQDASTAQDASIATLDFAPDGDPPLEHDFGQHHKDKDYLQPPDLYEINADDERRESNVSTISVSSIPESAYSDNDPFSPILKLYTPASGPTSRRYQSEGRSERVPPSPLGSRSPRRSRVHRDRSRTNTPRGIWLRNAKGSPRPRRRISEATEPPGDQDQQHYPLVLLHVTLLPVSLPWSAQSIQELLPSNIVEDLQRLKWKISETILSRGILISHPREEYELLEERLLEALELGDERITKCGHFRNRSSISSASDSDSGIGSSVSDSETELCAICQHHIRPRRAPVEKDAKKWTVRVFAANGLMPASAWAAGWEDMESVDVEILPWMDEELRRKLDERWELEEAEERRKEADRMQENERMAEFLEQIAREQSRAQGTGRERDVEARRLHASLEDLSNDASADGNYQRKTSSSHIPISVLLRNYIFLLARDRRNVALVFLGIVVVLLALNMGNPGIAFAHPHADRIFSNSVNRDPVPALDLASAQPYENQEVAIADLNGSMENVRIDVTGRDQVVRFDEICVPDQRHLLFSKDSDDEVCLANAN